MCAWLLLDWMSSLVLMFMRLAVVSALLQMLLCVRGAFCSYLHCCIVGIMWNVKCQHTRTTVLTNCVQAVTSHLGSGAGSDDWSWHLKGYRHYVVPIMHDLCFDGQHHTVRRHTVLAVCLCCCLWYLMQTYPGMLVANSFGCATACSTIQMLTSMLPCICIVNAHMYPHVFMPSHSWPTHDQHKQFAILMPCLASCSALMVFGQSGVCIRRCPNFLTAW